MEDDCLRTQLCFDLHHRFREGPSDKFLHAHLGIHHPYCLDFEVGIHFVVGEDN